ncbi:MAG: 30S ribosomal protein S4 [Candidatus Omnitrophica bacterium]|nr:30S ribosomal protein S4 [Candidatus Omnitrophota bacterium]MDD5352227.1 30S ribosomal protein S4 [Candidatus Omnitrophota bacterium]MDD5549825.1 30S ribosomal protein S4 [Candidatus Omnitrophota bacterium]
MARYIGSSCRLCRSEGIKMFLKGTRCYTDKCALARRAYSPGQHGKTKSKLSNYGLQLREKQKVKRMYGVLERQFRRYFAIASKSKGVTGEMLLQQLERRLDNVVLRCGFAASLTQARQIVRHGMISVNDKRVNIPSYSVGKEEIITVKNKENIQKLIRANVEMTKDRSVPKWIEADTSNLKAKILRLPERDDIAMPVKEQLIVELYSK